MPARTSLTPSPLTPSDARVVPVSDSAKTMERQRRVIVTTFDEWCKDSEGAAMPRDNDMIAFGRTIAVCELKTSGERIAALRVSPDPEAAKAGRHELYVEHWYPPDVARYIQERREASARQTAARGLAIAHRTAQQEAERAQRKAAERVALEQMAATVDRTRPTPACQRFERESNALRARFTVMLNRTELRRYTSDLAVALDECTRAKIQPTESLSAIYLFNLQSLLLFADVWDANLMCHSDVPCNIQGKESSAAEQREIGDLQARYAALRWLSAPERVVDILDRIHRFVPDR